MKLSVATVLVSISSASAFSVSYLNQLNSGASSAPTGAGITNYLDGMSGAQPQVPALVTALEQAAPAPVAPAPVAAAPAAPANAAPTSKDYLSALGGSSTPVTGGGLTSYLDALPRTPSTNGAGLTGYLDALPQGTAISGTGVTSYLDTVGGGSAPVAYTPPAPAAPVAAAPAAVAPVAAAPAAPVAPVAAGAAPVSLAGATSGYLSNLDTGANQPSGSGLPGYLDVLPQTPAVSGPGLTGYLNTLASNAAMTTGAGLTGYLDALATNSAIAGPAGGSNLSSFLENVYAQIMSLPEDGSRKVSGNSVAFATADGSYAMSFVKN